MLGPLIEVKRLVEIHTALVLGSVPSHQKHQDCLPSAIGPAIQSALYESPGDDVDILIAACFLARNVATRQCFMDGNKRVAWAALLEVLEVHAQVTLDADQEVAAQRLVDLSTGALSVRDFAEWVASNLVPIEM